jgi:nucleoside-diphosphate-sugar epimerase
MSTTPEPAAQPLDPSSTAVGTGRDVVGLRHVVAGAGPVGRAVVAALVARGITPTVVTRSGRAVDGGAPQAADLADPRSARAALATADVVYQCAQPAYHRWPQEFPGLQHSIMEASAAAGALLVVVDNLYAYGPVAGHLHEALPAAATTRKGRVRAAMWAELTAAHAAGQLHVAAARASDFVGAGVEGSAFGDRFFPPLLAGRGAEIVGNGEALHSVTNVADLAEAMVRLAAAPDTWGRAWHVPNAPACTIRELVTRAARIAGVADDVRLVAPWKLRLAGLFVPGAREMVEMLYEFDHDFVVDHSAYAARFGDHATPLDDSLRASIDWYRAHRGGR